MNDEIKKADEIVRALRDYASDCGDDDACGQCTFAWMCEEMDGNAPKIIADLIERLNDFEHSQCAVLSARIAELEAQLAESQRRERAAVDMCDGCNFKNTVGCHCARTAWRGPQEAGKGDSNG